MSAVCYKCEIYSGMYFLQNDCATTPDINEDEECSDVATLDPELMIKHPLQNRWALWYFKNDKSKDWASNLKLITSFDSVEDFWA